METMIVFRDWFHQPTMESEPRLGQQLNDLKAGLAEKFPGFISFEFLPFAFVDAPLAELQVLAADAAVLAVLASSNGWKRYRRTYLNVLRALNALRSETGYQVFEWSLHTTDGGTLPHERFQGGWWPPRGGYPRLRDGRYGQFDADHTLVMGAPPAWMPVINLSIGPPAKVGYEANDPVVFAMAAAAQTHLFVVAAGNGGPAPSTLNPWAADDAVLSVGATEDEDGFRLADYSSRGSADAQTAGPDVVAWGGLPASGKSGTSFAAPRVAMMGVFCASLLAQIQHAWLLARDIPNIGVPLMGWGMIDRSSRRLDLPERLDAPALPIAGVRWDAMTQALRDVDIRLHYRPPLLKKILMEAARPMRRYRQDEVRAGFLRDDLLIAHLGRLTVADVVRWFSPTTHVPGAIAGELAFAVDELHSLAHVVRRTGPTWFWDLARETFAANGRVLLDRGTDHSSVIAGTQQARRELAGHGFLVAEAGLTGASL